MFYKAYFFKLYIFFLGLVATFFSSAIQANAFSTSGTATDGNHGVLVVRGSLTENPCTLSMNSDYQEINIGNISFADLNRIKSNKRFPFTIELVDCLDTSTRLFNYDTGRSAWNSSQPGLKVRFIATADNYQNDIISVTGVKGMGLKITDKNGSAMALNKNSEPLLVERNKNTLIYYVSPVKTSDELTAGSFFALMNFEINYD